MQKEYLLSLSIMRNFYQEVAWKYLGMEVLVFVVF